MAFVDSSQGIDRSVVAVSSNFSGLFAAFSDGVNQGILVSHDSGQTFASSDTSVVPSTAKYIAMVSSGSGEYVLVSTDGNKVYYSENYGESFSRLQGGGFPPSICDVMALGISEDGKYMAAGDSGHYWLYECCCFERPDLYVSNDFGKSWKSVLPGNIGLYVYSLSMSASGQYLLLGGTDGQFSAYVSDDYGLTFTKTYGGGSGCYTFNTQMSPSGGQTNLE